MSQQHTRCFACNAKVRTDRVFLAHVAGEGEEQNVHLGRECHDKMQLHRGPWTPPKGGPPLLPGWR